MEQKNFLGKLFFLTTLHKKVMEDQNYQDSIHR